MATSTVDTTYLRNRVLDFLKATANMDRAGFELQNEHSTFLLRLLAMEDWTNLREALATALADVRRTAENIHWFRDTDKTRIMVCSVPLDR